MLPTISCVQVVRTNVYTVCIIPNGQEEEEEGTLQYKIRITTVRGNILFSHLPSGPPTQLKILRSNLKRVACAEPFNISFGVQDAFGNNMNFMDDKKVH